MRRGQALRVLVVDDDPMFRQVVCDVLADQVVRFPRHGELFTFAPQPAASLGEAVLLAAAFDVVLLDLVLPGVVGVEGVASVVAAAPWTAVVVVTGYGPADALEAIDAGATDFLLKGELGERLARLGERLVFAQRAHRRWMVSPETLAQVARVEREAEALCRQTLAN